MKRPSLKTGDLTLTCLLISIISGIVLAYQYNYSDAYKSIIGIDTLIPWGKQIRSLHWYSSQLFLIFLVIHTGEHILRGSYQNGNGWGWIRLVGTLPIAVLLMFTGYVLKGDITGASAGMIAEHLARAIPLVGEGVNRILFDISSEKLFRVYLNHILILGIVGGWFLWPHLKHRKIDTSGFLLLIAFLLVLHLIAPAPLSVGASDTDALLVKGPWFFLFIQEVLRYLPPFWGGIVICLIPLFLLSLLPVGNGVYAQWIVTALGIFLGCFTLLTTVAFLR